MINLIYKEEVFRIIGAAIEVHTELLSGFFEAVYQEALDRELREKRIPFVSHKPISIIYKGKPLQKEYVPDLLCF